MQKSIESLKKGYSVAIFPNVDYSNTINSDSKLYEGFLYLEKYYFKEVKEHITFIPIHVSKNKRLIIHGKPIQFLGISPFSIERIEIANKINEELKMLAKQYGDL